MTKTMHENFADAMLYILDELFDNVHGVLLDKNTSMFETLATITAEEASRPVSPTCATLAAQVAHVAFYLDTTYDFVKHGPPAERIDWGHIWRTVREVTPEEWEASKQRLRESYNRAIELVKTTPDFNDMNVIGGSIGLVAHTAYHLGEIRQALCTLKGT
ncbi:MAG: DinB family protein [Anaerolinea sp.]|nr:DinB family protein [Anaerolinea sp.]